MIKPERLHKGDKVALVSLSSGLFGDKENSARLERVKKNLKEIFDYDFVFMPNALLGTEEVKKHPELRAKDLMDAFKDPSIKGILTLTGGNDTIRILPYIDFDVIRNNPKVFIGFSDTTANHFMMYKAGLVSFYGPAAGVEFSLPNPPQEDIDTVLDTIFEGKDNIELNHYLKYANDPLDWSTSLLDYHEDLTGYELLKGTGVVEGELIGGCIDVFAMINGTSIWPSVDSWKDKVLFFETSDGQPEPESVRDTLYSMASQGILGNLTAILVGRPKNGKYYQEYNEVILEVLEDFNIDIPVIVNCHFGHAWLWHVMPIGCKVRVDADNKKITLIESSVK